MDSVRGQEIEELAKELGFSVAPLVVRGKEINHEVISYNGERKYATVCEIALWRALISTRTALEQAQQQVARTSEERDKRQDLLNEMPCGHPRIMMLVSAETGEELYCDICDRNDQLRDRATELREAQQQVAELQGKGDLFDEVVKRLRGAFVAAHLGEWREWQDAIDLFLKAAQAQGHLATLASERYDKLLQLESERIELQQQVAQLTAEREHAQQQVTQLRAALTECVDASVTDSDHCTVCLEDVNKHAPCGGRRQASEL